ncbi:MAG: hypothetical protein M3Q69_13465, partial [Acidobacteriota bacterium]|nr:hypothetical protein [Acidobacteriota bacterium]
AIQKEWLRTSEPPRFCTWHHDGAIAWPAEYRDWAKSVAPTTRIAHARTESFRITNPPNGATYLIDPTLRMQFQTLRLRAAAAGKVAWAVNGRPVESTEWALRPGVH